MILAGRGEAGMTLNRRLIGCASLHPPHDSETPSPKLRLSVLQKDQLEAFFGFLGFFR
jgi:hypothetical protein